MMLLSQKFFLYTIGINLCNNLLGKILFRFRLYIIGGVMTRYIYIIHIGSHNAKLIFIVLSITHLNDALWRLKTSKIFPCSQYSTKTYNSWSGNLLVQAPITFTMLSWEPKCIIIFNSEIKFSTSIRSGLFLRVLTAMVVFSPFLVSLA